MKIIEHPPPARARTSTSPGPRSSPGSTSRSSPAGRPRTSPASPSGCCGRCPGLAEHHCAAGAPGGFVSRMRGGTYFGHVTEHVARAVPADRPRRQLRPYGLGRRARPLRRDPGVPGRRAARVHAAGRDLLRDRGRPGHRGRRRPSACPPPTSPDRLAALRAWPSSAGHRAEHRGDHRRGPAARHPGRALRRPQPAAARLGQPPPAGLGRDDRPDHGVGIDIAGDKQLTRRLLEEAGRAGRARRRGATAAEQAVRLLARHSARRSWSSPGTAGRASRSRSTCSTPDEVERRVPRGAGGDVVVERQLAGRDYRVLVVAGEVVAAAERIAGARHRRRRAHGRRAGRADQRRPAPRARGTPGC